MEDIKKYNRAREAIEHSFIGLPHASCRLIQLLITKANPSNGIVENLSYRDLAILMTVDHAPGRKGAGIPKIDTIRSYLRTISKNCPDDFRLISKGHKLKCQFINMPEIYAYFCEQKEVSRDERVIAKPFESQIELSPISDADLFLGTFETEKESIGTQGEKPVKKFIIINNKQTTTTQTELKRPALLPIADDFKPSQETLAIAISRGYRNAHNSRMIDDFIDKNKAWVLNVNYLCRFATIIFAGFQ
ncbi:MAG: hypothetical protein H0U27_08020 [Nitrosopumilus sp.]|nr:hypothetical protein [Nitrosopumilus sp.]